MTELYHAVTVRVQRVRVRVCNRVCGFRNNELVCLTTRSRPRAFICLFMIAEICTADFGYIRVSWWFAVIDQVKGNRSRRQRREEI